MATSPRKKASRAERKAKTQKRLAQKQAPLQKIKQPMAVQQPAPRKVGAADIDKLAGGRKTVLQLGCRMPNQNRLNPAYKTEEWFEVRLDKNPATQPHIITNMTNLSMLPDACFDAVYASHTLDALNVTDVAPLFEEVWRILKWGGQFVLSVPDLQTIATYVAHDKLLEPIYDSPAGAIAPIDLIYGFRPKVAKGEASVRRSGFTASWLISLFRDNNYTNITVSRRWVELHGVAFKFHVDDPRRRETLEHRISEQTQKLEMPKPTPLNRTPHPGQFADGLLSDDLDIPPLYWKPIGIPKK